MTTTDIVARLIERANRNLGSSAKVVWNPLLRDAAAEIKNLRAERDEARRLWCQAMWLIGGVNPAQQAKEKGWDCFEHSDSVQNLTPEADSAYTP